MSKTNTLSIDYLMPDAKTPRSPPPGLADSGKPADRPEWARGLKRMYDSVVEEPLPDAFKDLLSRLDDGKS